MGIEREVEGLVTVVNFSEGLHGEENGGESVKRSKTLMKWNGDE